MRFLIRLKKGQTILISTMAMMMVLFLVITLFVQYIYSNPKLASNKYEDLNSEAQTVARILLSEGYPPNWTSSDVQRPGILTDGVFDFGKWKNFTFLTDTDYSTAMYSFPIRNDFVVFFRDNQNNIINSLSKAGGPGLDLNNIDNINAKNIAKMESLIVLNYNDTHSNYINYGKMVVYVYS